MRFMQRVAEQLSHLSWSREELEAAQLESLRGLLAHAKANAPFYADRLAGIDPDTATIDSLRLIPTASELRSVVLTMLSVSEFESRRS